MTRSASGLPSVTRRESFMRLEAMTIAVTGAQQGIGAAIARQAAREGANVVVNWLDDEAAARAVADDVAAVAVFLLAGESAHVTGQTLHVNGGEFLY